MKPSKLLAPLATLTLALGLSFSTASLAQEADKLQNYVPVLPQIKARALAVDPQKGYLVKQIKPDVYVITDGIYQSAFVTTGKGVILFDAPESFAQHIARAVAEVTREPIVQLVYSHAHLDHIAGAGLLVKQVPKLVIVAEADTAAFLREKKDPRRPIATSTFKNQRTLKLGAMTVELKKGQWHSPEGDLLIYLPGRKFLMAIDTLAAGHVPFMDFDLSTNMHAYLKVFDQLLAYDFDVLVPGHLTYLADRQDVQMTKDYALDVYKTVKRIHDGTDIAADYAAKSKEVANIMFTADFATLAANPFLFSKLPYQADKDFAPVGLLARFPMLLVVAPNVPATNLKEFLAWAKAKPEGVTFASAGAGSPHHLAAELLRERTGVKMQHVPYRGAAPAVQDLIGNHVPWGMMDSAAVQQHLTSGKLRAIGVASAKRLATFPEIPTLAEQGLAGFEAYAWQGLVVPATADPATVATLNKALRNALQATTVKARFQTLSLEALPGSPEQTAAYAKAERERWGKLIRDNGIRLD